MLTKDQIDALEATHKRISHLKGKPLPGESKPAWEIVLRKPTRQEYKHFRSMSHNPAQVAEAQEILARKCCVYPEKDAFDALLDDWPGIPEAAGGAFKDLLGLEASEDVK